MITVKHPIERCNAEQESFLKTVPDALRRYHELSFCHGNATYRYHQLALESNVTEEIFKEWLEGLQPNLRKEMEKKGFDAVKTHLPFTRYVNEKNDIGLNAFLKDLMGAEYEEYMQIVLSTENNISNDAGLKKGR